jgi:Flp pilus assembly pilin Flp
MLKRAASLFRDELGATLVEYAAILGLIAVVCLVSMRLLGSTMQTQFVATAGAISGSVVAANGNSNGNGNGNGNNNGNGNGSGNNGNGNGSNGNGNGNGNGSGNNGNGNGNNGNGP